MPTIVEQIDSETIDELLQRIVQAIHPLKILLFGSAAREQMGPDNDIDVLVVVPDGTHCLHTTQYLYQQLLGFGLKMGRLVCDVMRISFLCWRLISAPRLRCHAVAFHLSSFARARSQAVLKGEV